MQASEEQTKINGAVKTHFFRTTSPSKSLPREFSMTPQSKFGKPAREIVGAAAVACFFRRCGRRRERCNKKGAGWPPAPRLLVVT
jgi:hypothetical protein